MQATSTNTNTKQYVTMSDNFMSGWGKSKDKTNKLIFICDNYQEAEIVKNNAEARRDMRYVNITDTKPYYKKEHYLVQYKDKTIYPDWYKRGYFS